MPSKSSKKTAQHSNGSAKRGNAPGRNVSPRPASKAAALTERAWRKTYENRGKSKAAA